MLHKCHVYGCKINCNPKKLMCKEHWSMVPARLKMEILKHYRAGQCEDKRPSKEWLTAARQAINHVQKIEDL